MVKRCISLLSLGLMIMLASINCSGDSVSKIQNAPPNATSTENPDYIILADQHLLPEHKAAILNALDDWATKTNFTLKYKLNFIDMSTQSKDVTVAHTIKIYVTDPGPGLAGWTDWLASNSSAYILVEPSIGGEEFRLIMMHELGHAFNLSFDGDSHYHGPYQSVMYPNEGDIAAEVSCPEITAFCTQYGCQTDCTNIQK